MRFHRLDLNLLVCLDALLIEKSVSKAADRVCLSQSAMSEALARLREYFNDRLLVQVGKAMVPTPFALSLHRPIRDVLVQVEAIASSRECFDPLASNRKFTILASEYAVDVLLPKVTALLVQQAPGIRLDVRVVCPAIDLIENFNFNYGELDLLITPHGLASKSHPAETLYRETFTCVAWSENADVGDDISLDDYLKLGHVCVDLSQWRCSSYDESFMVSHGNIRRIEMTATSFRTALQLVVGTRRLLTCHRRHAELYARQYSLRLVEPRFSIPPIDMQMQWYEFKTQDPALAWFRDVMKSVAATI
jgi:DNA-binding transcriptional LysR family regulator